MTTRFFDFFNKLRSRFLTSAVENIAPRLRATRANKPEDEHFRKTVLPNTTRSFGPPDPFRVAAGAAASSGPSGANVLSPTGPTISRARDLPRALALALEPKVERTISLPLSDFIDQIPAEYIKPVEVIDASRVVALKASEIEKGMPEQNPSVTLTSLYQQAPEIFLRSVLPSNATRVPLPFAKVLEQFSNVRVREDQERAPRVPQLDTPIFQATLKDTARFGTKIEPLESSEFPPLSVEPASAESFASAEPEAFASEKARPPETHLSPPYPVISLRSPGPEPEIDPTHPRETTQSDLPPSGTGASASERVPASSGPPVPTPFPPKQPPAQPPPAPDEPKRIPFKWPIEDPKGSAGTPPPAMKPPDAESPTPDSAESEEDAANWITSMADMTPEAGAGGETGAGTAAEQKETEEEGEKIALALKAVLQNVPAFQLNGDIAGVPEEARIEFPLAPIKSQLASGRILIAPELFKETLPEAYRDLFVVDPADTPVSLPLQEVLKNLPTGALKIRGDQVHEAPADEIETPFSKRAKEDATRFQTNAPVQKAAEAPAPEPPAPAPPELPATGEAEAPAPAAEKVEPTEAERSVPETEPDGEAAPAEKIDGKKVLTQACQIPGVSACEITFPDGLSLAGNFPPTTGAEGLCAMAPMVLQRIDQHMTGSKLGSLTAMTLHSANSSVTFLMKKNICLAALHEGEGALTPKARAQLEKLVDKLSHTYAQPERPHVDH
jgi:predicted regulator of Ras-like GTPase activity (Roadblock/LC7/MglB family)